MKAIGRLVIGMVVFLFLFMTIPCEAGGGNHKGHGKDGHEHHHHDHGYRWFGVIPRPNWAAPYYYVPQYGYAVPTPYPVPPPANFSIGAPIMRQEEYEIIIVPQEPQSFEDYQKPIHIAIPEASATELQASVPEPAVPQPTAPRTITQRRIDSSKAPTFEKYVTGEVACPLDLPKGSIVRMCNAHSGKYKFPKQGDEKHFHQQQCWFCENILGGDYVRWQERTQ